MPIKSMFSITQRSSQIIGQFVASKGNQFRLQSLMSCLQGKGFHNHGVVRQLHSRIVGRAVICSCQNQNTISSPIYQQRRHLNDYDGSNLPHVVPSKGELVYVGQLTQTVKFVKAFSVSTSITALACQPFLVSKIAEANLLLQVAIGTGMGFFIMITPLLLHFLTKRYVTWMYYNPMTEEFTASTWSFFVREKVHKFTIDEVRQADFGGFLTNVRVRGIPLFIPAAGFRSREAYVKMMGLDKPMDWGMYDEDEMPNDKKKKEQQ